MLYVYWLLKWLYILIIINFEPYSNAGYTDQYFVQRGHIKSTWELGNFRNSLSNSLVTVQGLKLLTNNPWCGSDQLSKIPSIGNPCRKII